MLAGLNVESARGTEMRVYEAAKKHGVSSDVLIEALRQKGFEVKSHMSSVTPEMLAAVRDRLSGGKKAATGKKTATAKKAATKKKATTAKKAATTRKTPTEKQAATARKAPTGKKAPTGRKAPTGKRAPSGKKAPTGEKAPTGKKAPTGEKAPTGKKAPTGERAPTGRKAQPASATGGRRSIIPDRIRSSGPSAPPGTVKRKKPRRRAPAPRKKVDESAVRESIRKTLAKHEAGPPRPRKRRRGPVQTRPEVPEDRVRLPEFSTLGELARALDVSPNQLIAKAMSLGVMATVNQRLDRDTLELLAAEYNKEIEFQVEFGDEVFAQGVADPERMTARPPVIVIMGHVDHGKTSLLDRIRKSDIISGEHGGITQHIGAYEVATSHGRIVFLDTPGHEAFTAMRARGAQVTDLVVLVVAADDGVMPQTVEAINHARAADVPMLVAVNKIDVPAARSEKVKQDLMQHNIVVDSFGGNVTTVEVSAKTGEGIPKLLEMIALEAELLELKADPEAPVRGIVVESQKEEGRGNVFTVLVQQGTVRVGDIFVAGRYSGRVRALFDDRAQKVEAAGPSSPVQVLGADGVPQAGDTFMVVEGEKQARDISLRRQQLQRERGLRGSRRVTLEDLHSLHAEGKLKELRLVIKADTDGSAEVLADSFQKLSTDEIKVSILHGGVGAISEGDVLLAAASNAIVIGFHVRPGPKIRDFARREEVDVRSYSVIYEAIDEVKKAMEARLEPERVEEVAGTAEVRQLFSIPRVGTIAGCMVVDGSVTRNERVRVLRDQVVVYEGTVSSLKRFKDDAREVTSGLECGIGVSGFDDLKVGDTLETYRIVEKARTL
jgi:translation initiation factor IF-2